MSKTANKRVAPAYTILEKEYHSVNIYIYQYTAVLQWLEHLWNHENMLETAVV